MQLKNKNLILNVELFLLSNPINHNRDHLWAFISILWNCTIILFTISTIIICYNLRYVCQFYFDQKNPFDHKIFQSCVLRLKSNSITTLLTQWMPRYSRAIYAVLIYYVVIMFHVPIFNHLSSLGVRLNILKIKLQWWTKSDQWQC